MANKGQTDTSRFAYEVIMSSGARETIWKKIILCLEWLPDATNYEIATWLKVKPEKVWKRTGRNELSNSECGAIFDTKLRRLSPDGNPAIVYALSSRKAEYAHVIAPERHNSSEDKAHEYIDGLIEQGKTRQKLKDNLLDKKLVQPGLFGEEK